MKTVVICAVQAPFIVGGAEILTSELRQNLDRRGFKVDVVNVPFKWYPVTEIVKHGLAWRLLDVTESNGTPVDLVIPTKWPSYLVRHPRKVAWLYHQHREAYDLFGTPYCALTESEEHVRIRQAIQTMDNTGLGECRSIFTISKNVAHRLARYNGLAGEPLYPPPHHQGRYRTDAYGDFLFYVGRLDRLKRLDLAVDAMARTRSGARLLIGGTGPVEPELRKRIAELGIESRVQLLGYLSTEELLRLYAECRGAYYGPVNEDYGYVTVEAFLSRKPLVTTTDAGGPLEFVTDGVNGWVAQPEAEALAEAIDSLWTTPEARLREMGNEGRSRVDGITWDLVIDRLTEGL